MQPGEKAGIPSPVWVKLERQKSRAYGPLTDLVQQKHGKPEHRGPFAAAFPNPVESHSPERKGLGREAVRWQELAGFSKTDQGTGSHAYSNDHCDTGSPPLTFSG